MICIEGGFQIQELNFEIKLKSKSLLHIVNS